MVRQVRMFTEFANFYRRFIPNLSNIVKLLNELTRKNHAFNWTKECEEAFENLKREFSKQLVLAMADKTKLFQLECDAFLYATGVVLQQQDGDRQWYPVAYLSKSFGEAEQNYDINDCELLAIVQAFEEYHKYFYESPYLVQVFTDYKNLTYFRKP